MTAAHGSVDWLEMWLVPLHAEGSDQVLCLRESGKMILDFKAWKIRSPPWGWEVSTLVQLPTSILCFLHSPTAPRTSVYQLKKVLLLMQYRR